MKRKQSEIHIYNEFNFEESISIFLFEQLKQIEIKSVGKINIALSGGNTPLPILEVLKKQKLDWQRYNFFMVDERCVPIDDSSSNFGNIAKVLFNHISSSNFSMVQKGFSYNESMTNYKRHLIENVPFNENGIPKFDLILLGMGDDGHTASLFPETEALLEENEIVIINKIPQLNTERITITYPVILNANEIIVIVKGNSKEKIIDELYSGNSKYYPMLKVVKSHPNLKWLIG